MVNMSRPMFCVTGTDWPVLEYRDLPEYPQLRVGAHTDPSGCIFVLATIAIASGQRHGIK